jgi:hypothetical protein
VLTVTATELKSSNAASFIMPAAANERRPVKVKRSNGRGALSCFGALLIELPR